MSGEVFDWKLFGEKVAQTVKEYVGRELAPLRAKIAELEAQALKFRGVFADGTAYRRGDAVTWAGALWVATGDSQNVKPGAGGPWRLAVKRGEA